MVLQLFMFTHFLHYLATQGFKLCRLVSCELLQYVSHSYQSVFSTSFLLSLVIIQLSRKVPFRLLVCMLYPFSHTFWLFLSLNTATAIIAGHSYFIWKQQPSKFPELLKISFHTFQSSPAFKIIQNAIKNLHEGHTDVAAAIVKIALDNCFCKFPIFQKNFVILLSYIHFSPINFTSQSLHGSFEWYMSPYVNNPVGLSLSSS